MAIEMGLMRLTKIKGGLTHGQGLTDSVVSKWVLLMPAVVEISDFIIRFCDVSFGTSEQHIDARESRIKRDSDDLKKLQDFLEDHEPFLKSDVIMNISNGMKGDKEINCHKAFDIGVQLMQGIAGLNSTK